MSTNGGHESCDSAIDAYRTEIAALTAEVEQLRAALRSKVAKRHHLKELTRMSEELKGGYR